ncbi:MAG: hypothetical protein Q7K54_05790 [Candidatus Parcubacteria bacterium]|nr:hypothetical protein [Candidatus Parcubacteria bacterium]
MTRKFILRIIICTSAITLFLVSVYLFSFPRSVKSFGPLNVGDQAPIVSENVVEYEYLYTLKYKFYIYAVEKDMSYCALADCGMSGVLVSCMGGWLSADNPNGGAGDYGLKDREVEVGKSSIIVVADKNKKILGIYPNYKIQNIPYILKNYRNVLEGFDFCYDTQMPKKH